MFAKPSKEHHWLDQLIGEWNVQHDCKMPDGSVASTIGIMNCRSLRGMWLFTSEFQNEAGQWISFMNGKHIRR